MPENSIIDKIKKIHRDDNNQIDIILSDRKRTIVEAAAGSGKTKVLISFIAYKIATQQLSSTKKILALTFSVNAAYKIKKDVIEQIPSILDNKLLSERNVSKRVMVSNYHGLCRRILNMYSGRLLKFQKRIEEFNIVDDKEILKHVILTDEEKTKIINFGQSVKEGNVDNFNLLYPQYNKIILEKVSIFGYLTYNSIISLVLKIFDDNEVINSQYKSLFEYIVIDECQDTNVLGYALLKKLIGRNTKLLFFGDSLQRIYGFIGAIPNIMNMLKNDYDMEMIKLNHNYRFENNTNLLLLDRNIRYNSYNPELITDLSHPNIICANTYKSEYTWVINKIKENIETNNNSTILVKSFNGNDNTKELLNKLENENIPFFNALFTDESQEYIDFHKNVYTVFYREIYEKRKITRKVLEKCFDEILKQYNGTSNQIYSSLIILLRKFIDSICEISVTYRFDDLLFYIMDVLLNNGLKQYMNKIDEKVIVATIHAFKGLESDIVFLVDVEKNIFPSYYTCRDCTSKDCKKFEGVENSFIDELSVYYVAITRARKELYISFSKNQLTMYGVRNCNSSCFVDLPGIGYDNYLILNE